MKLLSSIFGDTLRYMTPDGSVAEGKTHQQVVAHLGQTKLRSARSRESYRRAVARRVLRMHRIEIPTDDDKTFVEALVYYGLLTRVP